MVTDSLAISIEPLQLFRLISKLPGAFFLDTGQPGRDNHFSFMGFQPRMQLRVSADNRLWQDGQPVSVQPSPLDLFDSLLKDAQAATRVTGVPFAGGAIIAIAYEAKNWIERLPDPPGEEATAPRLVAAIYDSAIVYSHRLQRYLVASWELGATALREKARMIESLVRGASREATGPSQSGSLTTCIATNMSREEYLAKVRRIKEYIASGDTYQVNFSQRFRLKRSIDCAELYLRLREVQPVPYGFYLDLGDIQIAGNSPERFLRRRGERLVTCPIKGTLARDARSSEAHAFSRLRGSSKDAAEHVMIVDVERNDLGRICLTGSVEVEELARPFALSTLYHLESTVAGRLPPNTAMADILRATFPSGSITGAPKIRAMEIIAELEPEPRGFYTGAVGYLDYSGDFELAMAIRTAVASGDSLSYSAGGGIVADSSPEREYEECLVKAQAFFRSLDQDSQAAMPQSATPRLP